MAKRNPRTGRFVKSGHRSKSARRKSRRGHRR